MTTSMTLFGRVENWFLVGALGIACLGMPIHALAQIEGYVPVTDAMLQNPDEGDWLNWRRTLDGQAYSPLDQITPANVGDLRLAWSWALRSGPQQTTPLVHDGVLFVANPGEIVQALDAATGDLIWQYERGAEAPGNSFGGPPPGRMHRNISMYEDKIYLNTADAHVVAIDARTGEEVWDSDIDQGVGYQFSSGSIIADGKVVSGLTGCGRYREESCYIVGLDAQTGEELWRTSTVALPGQRGGDTWGDLPPMFRAGSDSWIPGSYDPVTRTLFHGTSQAKPWARAVRGTDGDALYTNSTLALDPDTGEMKWYYQHLPGETLDMDEVFERILVDYDDRRSVFTMGKIGVLWEMALQTGRFRNAHDLGYQTVADIDPVTGQVTYRDGTIPVIGEEVYWCPSTSGFKSWRAMSYHPGMEAFFIPINLNCETAVFGPVDRVAGGGGTGPVRRTNHHHPDSDEQLGEFVAMSMRTGEVLWRRRFRTPINSAALTTAGGLAITGGWDREAFAFDAATGETLWETRLPTSVQGFPITYAVEGKQYVAIPTGGGGASWGGMLPAQLTPEKTRPVGGNGLFVFALP
ncbi:MAG: pyrrolo-quinoline quinone [Acidobacteria bacterium]|nr:pyrrolo-quinoline quinone [Acidobacteriota bacterium]